MIISHRHKFIFLHSLKTAGSSITLALAPFLGEDDFMSIDHFTIDDFQNYVFDIPTIYTTMRHDTFRSLKTQ